METGTNRNEVVGDWHTDTPPLCNNIKLTVGSSTFKNSAIKTIYSPFPMNYFKIDFEKKKGIISLAYIKSL